MPFRLDNNDQIVDDVTAKFLASRSSLSSSLLPDRLYVVGICLLGIYILLVLRGLLPLRLIDPRWQLSAGSSLIDNAPIALVAAVIMHFVCYLSPTSDTYRKNVAVISRLAILASFGFLLLIPLRVYSIWSIWQQSTINQTRQISLATQRLDRFRHEIRLSKSKEDLISRLRSLKAPPLPSSSDKQTFSQIKTKLNKALEDTQAIIINRSPKSNSRLGSNFFLSNLRTILSGIVFAIGFAAVAQRPKSPNIFLNDVIAFFTNKQVLQFRRQSKIEHEQMDEYINQLSSSVDSDKDNS